MKKEERRRRKGKRRRPRNVGWCPTWWPPCRI